MKIEGFLAGCAIGLPILAVLVLWRGDKPSVRKQRWTAAIALGICGTAALFLFLVGRQYTFIFLTGKGNCAYEGFGSLTVCLLSTVSAVVCLIRESNQLHDNIFLLLLNSAWAGVVLTESLLVTIIAFSALLIVVSGWVKARGGSVGYLVSQDDYRDDWGPK